MALFIFGAAACVSRSRQESPKPGGPLSAGSLSISGGPKGGVYQRWATAFAEQFGRTYPQAQVKVRSAPGGVYLRRLLDGDSTLTLTAVDSATEVSRWSRARSGVPLAAIARLYDNYVHLVVRSDSPVSRLDQVSGRRVVVGLPGSGTSLIADRVLTLMGVHPVRRLEIGLNEGLAAIMAGRADAMFWSGGIPTTAVQRLWVHQALRLTPLDAAGSVLSAAYGGTYRPATIPANTYENVNSIPTFAVATLLMGKKDMSSELVEEVLNVAFTGISAIAAKVPAFNAFNIRMAIETQPIPLHDGARAYYRAMKP
jgi:hypothetical protein